MLMKNILAVFSIAGLTAAFPAENLEARAITCPSPGTAFCCNTVAPLNFLFIKGIGSGRCVKVTNLANNCPTGKKPLCCASGRQIVDSEDGDVVCLA